MKFTQKQIMILAGGILLVLIACGAVYFGLRSSSQTQKTTLTIWGTDPKNVFDDMATAYKLYAPNVTVAYTQVNPADYANKLLNAFAAGSGPDLFEIGNHDLPKWTSVASPLPAAFSPQFNTATLQNDFPTAVAQDFVLDGNIYALPLDLDTLAMFYNKDLFDSAGIVYPPKTWDDFQADILRLRSLNMQGQITQSAAALGGSEVSIANAPDLIFLLMLQNGTKMISGDGLSASFNSNNQNNGNPGLAAFNFYLQFANPASTYYTWSDALGDALQNFIAGKAAIIFDYASEISAIKQRAPFLNFGIAAMPQPANATIDVNYPKYEGLAVSKQGQVSAAWQFILYTTTNQSAAAIYSKDMSVLPASRAYIEANLNDPTYGIFASQALTARSWYEADDGQIDSIVNTAVQNVLNGAMDSSRALSTAQDAVTAVMRGE